MKAPLISIIIPVYNVAMYLRKCMDSVVNQSYKNIEIIIINDGSTDDCEKICNEYLLKDNRIKLITQINQGISAARNVGVLNANGDFIIFVDSDDWVDTNYISILLSKMDEGFDMVMVAYFRAYQNQLEQRCFGWQGEYNALAIKRRLLGLYKEELKDPSQADSMVTVWGKLYITKVIKQYKIEFVDTDLIGSAEDLLINLQYIQHVEKVFVIDRPLYFYRKDNLVSFTKNYRPKLLKQWQVKYNIIEETVSITTDEEKSAFQNRIAMSIIGIGLNEIVSADSIIIKIKKIKQYISSERYKKAIEQLNFSYFPIHWYIFFKLSKKRNALLLFGMIFIMDKILKYNKK
jgi:glycosyltransferase involved in cell wall biosynthesis